MNEQMQTRLSAIRDLWRRNACAVCVDMGTTNTRVWVVHEGKILTRARAGVGVRDAARDKSNARLRAALHDLIVEARANSDQMPSCIIAAGMITSPLGLIEVPHVPAPAGAAELARGVECYDFPEISDLPFLFVPGVRSGDVQPDANTIDETDVMRGEETLCVGLIESGVLKASGTLLNLGSHWKAIKLDSASRIAASVTSMSGELIHTTQTNTILASAVPQDRLSALDGEWVEAGMRTERKSGLGRAMFCVRLLEQAGRTTPEQRFAFLIGAFIAADLDKLIKRRLFDTNEQVVITGGSAAAAAYKYALAEHSISADVLSDEQIEQALLGGLGRIAAIALHE